MASGGLHYMLASSHVSHAQSLRDLQSRRSTLPDRHLVRSWSTEFLQFQLCMLSWPEESSRSLILQHQVKLCLLSERDMWRLILDECEPQFFGELQYDLQALFGVSLQNVRDGLRREYGVDLDA